MTLEAILVYGALIVFWLLVAAAVMHVASTRRDIVAELVGVGTVVALAVGSFGEIALWFGVATCALLLVAVAIVGFAPPKPIAFED